MNTGMVQEHAKLGALVSYSEIKATFSGDCAAQDPSGLVQDERAVADAAVSERLNSK